MTVVAEGSISAIVTFVRSGPFLHVTQKAPTLSSLVHAPRDVTAAQRTLHIVGALDSPFKNSPTKKQQTVAKPPCAYSDATFVLCSEDACVAVKVVTDFGCTKQKTKHG